MKEKYKDTRKYKKCQKAQVQKSFREQRFFEAGMGGFYHMHNLSRRSNKNLPSENVTCTAWPKGLFSG